MAPPANWSALAQARCGVALALPPRAGDAAYMAAHGGMTGDPLYITPTGCVLVDRVTTLMYDVRLCLHAAGRGGAVLFDWADVSLAACGLVPQPLSLLLLLRSAPSAYSMTYTDGGRPLGGRLSDLAPGVLTLDSIDAAATQNAAPSRDHVSHVLDWWPDSSLMGPPGFHVTASTDPSELAPMLFDSHYLYDPAERKAFYAHSVARNGSLLYDTVGAGGVCRAPNVGMPLVDANTNRILSLIHI